MKLSIPAVLLLPTLALSTLALTPTAFAAPQSCAEKIAQIKTQLDYAHQHNNKPQIDGLQKALTRTQKNCSDSDLAAKKQRHIEQKQKKVAEREQDLKEAQASGRQDKIEKKQARLDRARQELQQAQEQ